MNVLDAWQAVLAGEHEAMYGYGIVGGRLGPQDPRARAAIDAHRTIRSACIVAIKELGAVPVAAAPAYSGAIPPDDEAAEALAADIEGRCSFGYLQLVGNQDQTTEAGKVAKEQGTVWLQASAHAQWRWNEQIPSWPGYEG